VAETRTREGVEPQPLCRNFFNYFMCVLVHFCTLFMTSEDLIVTQHEQGNRKRAYTKIYVMHLYEYILLIKLLVS